MQSSPELANVIRGWFLAVAAGDPGWVERHVATQPGVRLIGTDPAEVFSGAAAAQFLRNEATALQGLATVEPGEVEAFTEGDVGWGFARPLVSFDGAEPVSPRWTAVFHREAGEWKLVQLHASAAVGNAEVGFEDHD